MKTKKCTCYEKKDKRNKNSRCDDSNNTFHIEFPLIRIPFRGGGGGGGLGTIVDFSSGTEITLQVTRGAQDPPPPITGVIIGMGRNAPVTITNANRIIDLTGSGNNFSVSLPPGTITFARATFNNILTTIPPNSIVNMIVQLYVSSPSNPNIFLPTNVSRNLGLISSTGGNFSTAFFSNLPVNTQARYLFFAWLTIITGSPTPVTAQARGSLNVQLTVGENP